ncbi:MAG: heparan-alpha-glucosaminide N-acetyltransferase domain-containing protein [Bacteroidota bacterium]
MAEPAKVRYLFVDLLRAWAVILMIEGHILNSLLRPDLKETTVFNVIHFLNGIVAPAFLFMAGFTFAVASQRKWDDYLHLRKPLFRQAGRLGFILILAYVLHLPYFSLRRTIQEATPQDLASLFQVDVLHTIAISLLILLLILIIVRREKWLRYSAFVLTVIVVFSTPVVWDYDFTKVFPLPIADYFNAKQLSLFPLFPWAGFVFCGTLASQYFLSAQQRGEERRIIRGFFVTGAVVVLVGYLSDKLPIQVYWTYDFWHTSPSFFMIRLGIVMLALSGMWWYEKKVTPRPGFMQVIGQESLFVYALHIIIVYGTAIPNGSLAQIFGSKLDFAECLGVYLTLTVFTCLIAMVWHYLKTNRRGLSRVVQYATVGVLLYFFVTRPY